ncbi:Signal transduction histidine kinase [Anaerocolumna aminovalerica]|uniref:histidine kinase n=2 Tax=Anaerocolumna aminovalerica TaxID=1527 RepID=A0A1I5F3U5_9FIRM|nr:Signal transduction histidine kinase [Anaerocolumna aminovalerica]
MKKMHTVFTYISSCKIWLISMICVDVLFLFFAWVAYPGDLLKLAGLMLFVILSAFIIPLTLIIRKHKQENIAFQSFLLEPDETNEYLLSEFVSPSLRPYVHELGQCLREKQAEIEARNIQVTDYEYYIENWVHEIKKPLSLMTLLLDNRKDEISPRVHTRMLYARDHIKQDVEQILYFSRLGAVHKDYYWEPLSINNICKEAVTDNSTLLDEAGFQIEYSDEDYFVVSDQKGLMFILGQIISNSVKYSDEKTTPLLRFEVKENTDTQKIILSINDNGLGIPPSDLPFIFDKGFTGDTGSYLSRSTGMGLYLVQKMADDLNIRVHVQSHNLGYDKGTAFSLIFPKISDYREG